MELAIDTSTRLAGVALARHGQLLAELTWRAEYNHTAQLLPAIDYLLQRGNLKPSDLDAVIVAVGPGSFSGLRVGMSAAKGLAVSLDIPLVGVGTLAVEAYPFLGPGMAVCPVLDAGRGELAAALFRDMGGELAEERPASLCMVEELCAWAREPTLFCGEHLLAVQGEIARRLGPLAAFPPASALVRRPGNLAELGWRRLAKGERDDPATLAPIYLRGPSISRPRAPTHS